MFFRGKKLNFASKLIFYVEYMLCPCCFNININFQACKYFDWAEGPVLASSMISSAVTTTADNFGVQENEVTQPSVVEYRRKEQKLFDIIAGSWVVIIMLFLLFQ